ncbi:SRPBCC family protein [Hymenobacter sp. BT664]|uniref:SRPBCC family protein n=1 Tax=Hymenobacter montanus TaxID=2771359 RepID=A0A927BAL9_9BACT|nr:SRPBCC family protein [Hymenobacter montanus]MBD2766785.1 SRPBCC family protein [Hymenobacter montanus]
MEPFAQHPDPDPSDPRPTTPPPPGDADPHAVKSFASWAELRANPWACAVLAVLATGLLGCGLMWLSVGLYESYSWVVFCLSPGISSCLAVMLNHWARPTASRRLWSVAGAVVGVMAVAVSLLLLLASGGEGVICVLMALPFAIVIALLGAMLGEVLVSAAGPTRPLPMLMIVLLYPAAQEYEVRHPEPAAPRRVTTQLTVNAPPAAVWAALLQPVDYPAATGWFRAGVVYPTRTAFALDTATGRPTLVCNYSQGRARLPVVDWQPGRSLTFAVPAPDMPAPMRELSPYPQIHAPHLHGYFQVDSGTFRLRPLPGGRTLLEARTVYRHAIGPRAYWELWSDYLLDAMHTRVLATLKAKAENAHD